MRTLDTLGLARDNLSRARLRTALTAIGVAIGTAAIITLASVGNGVEAFTINRAASFGQLTLVAVYPRTAVPRANDAHGQAHALTPTTLRAITRLPHVDSAYGWLTMPPLRLTTGAHGSDLPAVAQEPLTGHVTLLTRVVANAQSGVLVSDTLAQKLKVAPAALVGRQITLTAGGGVCCSTASGSGLIVLGPDRHFSARVAGVYQGASWNSPAGLNIDQSSPPLLLTPALGATVMGQLRGMSGPAYLERQGYDLIFAHADDARQTAGVARRITAMRYQVFDRADLLAQVHTVFSILTAGLAALGGIALLVAGIGIANTMIMTILERTREIGVMKALGAESGVIRRMFLVETALVGLLGGLGGVALAALGGLAGNVVFHAWLKGQGVTDAPGSLFIMPLALIVGALALAVLVSLLSGTLPSRRAVRLQPLDALRYE